jgi:tryptophan-rich sensory protein
MTAADLLIPLALWLAVAGGLYTALSLPRMG